MTVPASLGEYENRFRENVRSERQDGQDVLCFPCPFCASRDWYVVPAEELLHSSSVLYCDECERSARFVAKDGTLELVQVSGPDAPGWLPEVRHENPHVVIASAGRLPEPAAGRVALRVKPTPPPNLRRTKSTVENCHMCRYMDRGSGLCERFNWQVERDEVCDEFEARS